MWKVRTEVLLLLSIALGSVVCDRTRGQDTKSLQTGGDDLTVLVVRGGHAYDTPAFEQMCGELEGMKCDLVLTAHFERMTAEEIQDKYDAILFLNQNNKYTTADRDRKRYMALADRGVGMVFLHFTLSSEPEWDEYHDLVGGKWFLKKFEKNKSLHSTYFTDMTVDIKVLDANHPTTVGLNDFTMTDAFYGNIQIESNVKPLLGADRPEIAETIAWTHRYRKSKVVYLMPGLTEKAYRNDAYRKFLANSIKFVAVAE
jgi:type 1 glutamine amidotransferase